METRHIERLEFGLDFAAAAIFAAAIAYALIRLGWSPVIVAVVAGAALLASARILMSIKAGSPAFAITQFDTAPLPDADLDELVLTDADRLDPADKDEHVDE
ncbi:MAG TPA: hypothetical protein VF067_03815, partial [Sphingomicrobium sp.]